MNQGRSEHGTTLIDGTLYVVAGYDRLVMLNSIEKLDVETAESAWSMFTVSGLSPRNDPYVCRLSATQILVAGGWGGSWLKDVNVIDLEARSALQVTQCEFGFKCWTGAV